MTATDPRPAPAAKPAARLPPDTPGFEAWRERQKQREEREKQEAAAGPA